MFISEINILIFTFLANKRAVKTSYALIYHMHKQN